MVLKIYRDGIITTPFAEEQQNPDAKRDVLGIDKRLWQDIFSRISSREFLGVIEITKRIIRKLLMQPTDRILSKIMNIMH